MHMQMSSFKNQIISVQSFGPVEKIKIHQNSSVDVQRNLHKYINYQTLSSSSNSSNYNINMKHSNATSSNQHSTIADQQLYINVSNTTVRMSTKNRVYVMNAGDAIHLECSFSADKDFNLFHHYMVWKKEQLSESTQINMLVHVLEPFLSTRRFNVSFAQKHNKTFLFKLLIARLHNGAAENISHPIVRGI
ncbi:hypothetical protein HELRODRAFT_168206 [Helobdella robusta]|uniref:Uncharacterized protein n=1 Tax=Helobdella robusta TaxID=6412 RepID=T1F0B1_HELRO|nr:hypothetical protein HELRODRAFT_168206 [Helobdella robusta]ESO09244.1 hypothetical protein HELRODRAFT_168206 [Helobdella robusta]